MTSGNPGEELIQAPLRDRLFNPYLGTLEYTYASWAVHTRFLHTVGHAYTRHLKRGGDLLTTVVNLTTIYWHTA
jgi:hypothetical protein